MKSGLYVLGGDGLGLANGGSEERVMGEVVGFARQTAGGLIDGLNGGRLEQRQFGTGQFETVGEVRARERTSRSSFVRRSGIGDRQDRLGVIYVRSADGNPGSSEVAAVEGDDE